MNRILKKAAVMIMAAAIGVSMNYQGAAVFAGTNNNITKQARYVEPEEWNRTEIKAYQFDSTDKFENYLLTGGAHLYNKNFKQSDRMVKITVEDPGYFVVSADTDGDGSQKVKLYDSTKKKVLAQTTSDGDLEYGRLAKTGETFYIQLPAKIDKIIITSGVIKDEFGSMKASDTYYESGTGAATYHPFSISKRSAVEFNISAINRKGGETYAYIEKKEKGVWKRLDNTVKIEPASYDDDFIHGLQKGEYRLLIKAPKTQLNAVSFTKSSKSKNVAYKKSKAINVKSSLQNVYTTEEHTARWYKVAVSSTKKRTGVLLSKYSVGGGFQFKVYQKGKVIKTVKVKKDDDEKYVTLPKKKGTYYIKVSKLTDKTTGVYELETYKE